jgi:predicted nucleic acid-binding protein
MKPVVLDTDVVSFLFKSDSRAQAYLPHLRDRQWLISFMTEAELEQWALLANWHTRRIDWLRIDPRICSFQHRLQFCTVVPSLP